MIKFYEQDNYFDAGESGYSDTSYSDQEAALSRAEETLEQALGTGVRVRAARRGIRVEMQFDDLDELHAFARATRRD